MMVSLWQYIRECCRLSSPNFMKRLLRKPDLASRAKSVIIIEQNENETRGARCKWTRGMKKCWSSCWAKGPKQICSRLGIDQTVRKVRRFAKTHVALPQTNPSANGNLGTMVAPLSGTAPAFAVSQLSHGVRQVILCKDEQGKVGVKVKSINKGVFVCLVAKNSPAAMGGLRFGDQILQINGDNVAGFNENKVHDIFKKAPVNNIVLAVRDRPFERTLTLHKDSTGHLGFQFKDGKITAIAVNSSAARNGLLIDHNLLEVNGQNVVGVKDKETTKLIDEGGQIVTITVIPNFLYQHMVKNMASSLVKKMMDHSMPDI